MNTGNSIINFGDLSKPATVLVEKISDAVGGVFKPWQIVRVANAEAEADRIRAGSKIQISDPHRRAMHRFFEEEAKKQQNIEEITRQALPELKEESHPENVEDDWIVNFFDKCRLVSDGDMQKLWSRVLAGEANLAGSYSKRTVNFLSSLDKIEAELFTQLCTHGWFIGNGVVPLIFDVLDNMYGRRGINFNSLSHLDSIGLIKFENLGGYARIGLPKVITVSYYGTPVELEFPKESDNKLVLGTALLTMVGAQLAPICGSQPDPDFFKYVVERWETEGYIKQPQDTQKQRAEDTQE